MRYQFLRRVSKFFLIVLLLLAELFLSASYFGRLPLRHSRYLSASAAYEARPSQETFAAKEAALEEFKQAERRRRNILLVLLVGNTAALIASIYMISRRKRSNP